ncbi:MAG: hypothetical protein IJJ60_00005, partial [Clostridia bacterium]|nr:hypothetical protein [Clostridia bacterium]
MKKKSILRRLIPWLITAVLLFCLVYFVGIPLYSQKEEQVTQLPEVSYYEGGKDAVVLENDALRFELDPTTTQFKLTEKANGREWL